MRDGWSHDEVITRYNDAIDRVVRRAYKALLAGEVAIKPDIPVINEIAKIFDMDLTTIHETIRARLGMYLKNEIKW